MVKKHLWDAPDEQKPTGRKRMEQVPSSFPGHPASLPCRLAELSGRSGDKTVCFMESPPGAELRKEGLTLRH
jgi:hypothetical protein